MRIPRQMACLLVLLVGFGLGTSAAEVKIDAGEDSYRVRAQKYEAFVDKAGHFRSLKVGGGEFWAHGGQKKGGAFPGLKPPALSREAGRIVAKSTDATVSYTFKSDRILVEHEGGPVVYALSRDVKAVIGKNGQVFRPGEAGGFFRKVMTGSAAIAFGPHPRAQNAPDYMYLMHSANPRDRIAPQLNYMGRSKKTLHRYTILCDVPFEPAELLTYDLAAKGQNRFRVPQYEQGETAVFVFTAENLSDRPVDAEVQYELEDHYANGETVMQETRPLKLEGGAKLQQTIDTPVDEPGFYWIQARIKSGERILKHTRMGWTRDAADYRPPLTRPADFNAFWNEQLRRMRALPFDAKLHQSADRSTQDAIWYDLEMTIAGGKRLKGMLSTPRKPGKYTGRFSEIRGTVNQRQYSRWKNAAAENVFIGLPWPETATYRTWNSRTNNNLLECYLLSVRMCDYLRSRKEVDRIVLKGASRSGPVVLVTAALDPTRILYVDAHVPTCMGISWTHKPYRGWGGRPGGVPRDKYIEIARYVDPVNFAPMLRVPFITDCGIYDDLAPAPGVIAFCNLAENAPWKRCSVEKGGHGFFTSGFRKQAHKELEMYLKNQQ